MEPATGKCTNRQSESVPPYGMIPLDAMARVTRPAAASTEEQGLATGNGGMRERRFAEEKGRQRRFTFSNGGFMVWS
jgi:hypothetical protein